MTLVDEQQLQTVGHHTPRVDGHAKVTGTACFGADIHVPGALHAAIVRSHLPHARLLGVDTAAALETHGVACVLTSGDLARVLARTRFGPVIRDTPVLAEDVVRYEGEPVAVVLAATPQAARAGAACVRIELEELPVLATVEEALADGAPPLHGETEGGEFGSAWSSSGDSAPNVAGHYHDLRGDPDGALASGEPVFSHEYRLAPLQHYALENHVVTAVPDGDELVVHTPNQYPFLMVRMLAGMLGRPESSIRVVVPYVGGGFGSKEYVNVVPIAAACAVAVNRPVRLELSVEESFRSSGRHGAIVRFTTGITEGRIAARKIELLFDTGAYADQGPRVIRQAGYRAPGPYRIPNLQVDAYAVYTNKVPAGAYRGFGASQPIHGCECHMDEIAEALGLDPVTFRLDNLLELGDDFAEGDLPLDCDIPTSLNMAVERTGRAKAERLPDGRVVGVGVAVGVKNTASGRLPSRAIVRLHRDGSATVVASGVELGQGGHTVMAQVAAETLGIPYDRVRVAKVDTGTTPFDQRTSSSRTTVHLGIAVQRAAEDVLAQLRAVAGEDVDPADADAVAAAVNGKASGLGGEIVGVGTVDQDAPEAPTAFGMRAGYWEGSVGAARVAVDLDTGAVEVLQYVTVADAGRVINPHGAHGQEVGGAVMAVGHALTEALDFDGGYLANPSPVDYRVPLAADVPGVVESLFLERGDGPGPFGSKGLGESSIITVAPAIANAIAAATGVRVRELPIRPWAIVGPPR